MQVLVHLGCLEAQLDSFGTFLLRDMGSIQVNRIAKRVIFCYLIKSELGWS